MDSTDSTKTQQQPSGNEPIVMHQMEHSGVICDICNTAVSGFRYKCTQCPDFDLCHSCEIKGHHVGHVMLRIPFPEQSIDATRHCRSGHRPHEVPFHFRRAGPFGRHGGNRCGGMNSLVEELLKNFGGLNAFGTGTQNSQKMGKDSQEIDWTAASLQLQELFNAWGVPINVADICSEQSKNHSASTSEGKNDMKEPSDSSSNIPDQQPSTSSGIPPQQPSTSFFAGNTSEPFQSSPLGAFLNNTLKNPQVQQIIQGVATAAESAARSNPNANPWAGNGFPNFTAPSETANAKQQDEINTSTLNQLLSMGFSNESGWLERLVVAKKGNLEAVLNSLFSSGETK